MFSEEVLFAGWIEGNGDQSYSGIGHPIALQIGNRQCLLFMAQTKSLNLTCSTGFLVNVNNGSADTHIAG